MKKIGIVTSGGDAPGMNAAIRSITKSAIHNGLQPVGVMSGFEGLMKGYFQDLRYADVDNIIQRGGTILGTARCSEFETKEGRKTAINQLVKAQIDGLVIIGGDGSFRGGHELSIETDIQVVGIPGTIDNDLYGTESTIGYDTALNTIVCAVDNIRDTASSQQRIFFIEVMGRNSGFLALNSAIASGAESVLIPEVVTDIEELANEIRSQNKGRRSSIIIVAEGEEEGGAMDIMRKIKPYLSNFQLRTTILGHIQRGGAPSYFDRALATRSGVLAVELLLEGKSKIMVGYSGDELITIPLKDAFEKHVTPKLEKEDILKKLLTK